MFDDVGVTSGEHNEYDDDEEEEEYNTDTASFNRMFWNLGMTSFQQFVDCLENITTKSLSLTRDVLQEREHLETHVEHLHQQVTKGIHMFEQLQADEQLLQKYLEDVESNKDFKEMREEVMMNKIPLPGNTNTTTCLTCNYTCHKRCTRGNDEDKMLCCVMDANKGPPSCRYCTNRCPWDKHKNMPYIIEYSTIEKEVTIDDIKRRYEKAEGEKMNKEQVITKVQDDIDAVEAQIKANLSEITVSLERLNEIALRTNHLSQLEYLDLLIQSEKDQGKRGWKKRVQGLQVFRDKAQALYNIAQGKYDPFAQYRKEANEARQERKNMQNMSVWLNVSKNVKHCMQNASKEVRKLFS